MADVDPDEMVDAKKAEIKKELLANKALKNHYDAYVEESIHQLIDLYAFYKANFIVHGNFTQFHHKYVLKEWSKRAWFALAEIQHKKLFDLQCRWRAGEVELENIIYSFEFEFMKTPILDLKLIEDVNEQDVEEYIHFLQTPNGIAKSYSSTMDYQDHEMIKAAHLNGNGEMPEYYEYHYTIHGNTGLLSLPDYRGEKEEQWIKKGVKYVKKVNKKKKEKDTKPVTPRKKYIAYHKTDVQIEFAKFLGEKDVAGFLKDQDRWKKEKPELTVKWAMEYLSFCYPEPVPMPAAPMWQDAVLQAALTHITEKVQQILPSVHQEYLMKKELQTSIGHVELEHTKKYKPIQLKMIEIAKRVENGENVDPSKYL
ncbi:MAG: hypothetical protein AAGC64_09875 [Bacteroidota bacterium]